MMGHVFSVLPERSLCCNHFILALWRATGKHKHKTNLVQFKEMYNNKFSSHTNTLTHKKNQHKQINKPTVVTLSSAALWRNNDWNNKSVNGVFNKYGAILKIRVSGFNLSVVANTFFVCVQLAPFYFSANYFMDTLW